MSRRNRDRRPARSVTQRDSRPLILVVCEGEFTEKEYLEGFRTWCKNPRVRIEFEPAAGVPKSVVGKAKELKKEAEAKAKSEKDENLIFDEIWAVFDVDDHPNLAEARTMARDNEILLTISNPNFELWLLLHFQDSPGMHHRDIITSLLKKHLPGYAKHVDFPIFADGHNFAVTRASRLDDAAKVANEEGRNPSTGVFRLTESIRRGASTP